jgi:hypothetical protein
MSISIKEIDESKGLGYVGIFHNEMDTNSKWTVRTTYFVPAMDCIPL